MPRINDDMEYPQNLRKEVFAVLPSEEYKKAMSEPLPEDFEGSLKYVLYDLNPQQRQVIRLRYCNKKVYSEIGEVMGVTKERIRQVERAAISKLRHPLRLRYIRYGVRKAEKMVAEEVKQALLREKERENQHGNAMADIVKIPLLDLKLTLRPYNCLARAGVKNVGDIIELGSSLYKVRNMGTRSVDEVLGKLANLGIDCTPFEREQRKYNFVQVGQNI